MTKEKISSKIWNEIPEKDDPFTASVCLCRGFDVYNDLLQNASWIEYLYLLFLGEKPDHKQARLLEAVAVVLANPGIRDHSVRASMNGAVSGSTNAAILMSALAVGAGQLGGAREILIAMQRWADCGCDIARWQLDVNSRQEADPIETWPRMEHPAGFDPHALECAQPVATTLDYLAELYPGDRLSWLQSNRVDLEEMVGMPLGFSGVVSAAFADLGLNPEQGEMLFLYLRLPGAAVHALEQKKFGWRRYPIFADDLEYQPGDQEQRMNDE